MDQASQAEKITVVSWTLASITIVAVGARLFSRLVLTRNPGWDDAFIVLSLSSALVCSALVSVGIGYGLGMHYHAIPSPADRINAFKYTILAPNFSVISTTTGKISVVLFLIRVMGQAATKLQRYFLYVVTVISVVVNIMCIVVLIGFCVPAQSIWNPSVPGNCMSLVTQLVIGLIQASYNAFTDLSLAVFPIFVFWNVQLALKVRITIIGVMSAGIFAAAATTVKAVLLKQLPNQEDITWAWAPITLWYSNQLTNTFGATTYRAEMYVIIICATLPTLRQFILFLMGRSYHNSAGRSSNRYDYNSSGISGPSAGGSGRQGKKFHSVQLSSLKTRVTGSRTLDDSIMLSRGDYDNISSSQENIVPPDVSGGLDRSGGGGNIQKTTEVHVSRE